MATLPGYTGDFDRAAAWHLLRRGTFGARAEQVDQLLRLGLDGALDQLFTPDHPLRPPINYDEERDPNVPVGETWVSAPYVAGVPVNNARIRSIRVWLFENFLRAGTSLERRMMLFFVNHFGAERLSDTRIAYRYYELMRAGWRMRLPDLVKAVTVEPMMLFFLDGRTSKATSPNENYARELLELFTVGKGPQVGPGDYTHYTETDVREIARALTGWRTRYTGSEDATLQPEAYFDERWHDTGVKRLSPRLGGAIVEDAGAEEYARVVDMIFEQPSAGVYFCRKLYRWFCHYDVTEAVEREVIAPMAEAFRAADYEIAAPLRLLLRSAHFFEARFRGALVKSPLEEVIDHTVALGMPIPTDLADEYWTLLRLNGMCEQQEMRLTVPPSVAGYKPYYQAPLYNRFWINAATLQFRTAYVRSGLYFGYRRQGAVVTAVDLLDYVASFAEPADADALVREVAERLLPVPLTEAQYDALKAVLIPGLPDFEWTVEYGKHLDAPDDDGLRMAVLQRLRDLFYAVASSAEYHLF